MRGRTRGTSPAGFAYKEPCNRLMWTAFGSPTLRLMRQHPNAGAVAGRFKECETECIFLSTEHAADEPFPVLGHPITLMVFGDLEVVRRQYRPRREGRHRHCTSLLHRCSSSAPIDFPIAIRVRERFEPSGINSSYRSGYDSERAPTVGAAAARLRPNLVRAGLGQPGRRPISFGETLCPDKQDYQCRPQHRSNEHH
jgi:hypothetical protein